MYNYDESYDDLRARLLRMRNELKSANDPKMKTFVRDFEKLMELLLFALIKERDNFYALVILQMNRKVDLLLQAPAAVNFQGTYFNLFLNPFMMLDFNLSQMKAILIHECFHIFNEHFPRAKKFEKKVQHTIVNIGLDCAINQYIDRLPEGCVTIQSLRDDWGVKTHIEPKREAEYYITLLKQEYQQNEDFKDKVDQQEQQNQQSMNGQGNGNGQGGNGEEDGDSDPNGSGNGINKEQNMAGAHDKWNESDDEGQEYANVKDVVKRMLNDAQQKARGTIPAEIQELIKKLNEPPIISWQQLLKKYVGTIPVPYKKTIMRRNRRQPNRFDLRGRLSDREVEIVVAIDTSGSVSNAEIDYCINEVFDIVKHTKHTVTIVECDAKIGRVYEANKPSDVKPDVSGRGGTYFQPVFDWVKENNKQNAVVVYFTDGGGERSLSEKPKCYKLLWVITRGGKDMMSLEQPYGEIKLLDLDNKWKKRK